MKDIYVNIRNLNNPTSGVQRYTNAIINRLKGEIKLISPKIKLQGILGHLWEQFILPFRVRGSGVLWSPSNTGPYLVSNQVITIHDLAVFDFPAGFNPIFSTWYRFLLPLIIKKAKKIITISEFTKRQILIHTKVDPVKIVVIHIGVSERFIPVELDHQELVREKTGIASSKYILALGSIEPRKNMGRLLDAWAIAQRDLPEDIILVLAGGQGKSDVFSPVTLKDLPPRVLITGYVSDDDLPALYSGAIVMIFPSLYEGFGLPPLESMACGTPVIVSNTASLPEVIGDAGLFVDPYNIEDIASAIYSMVTDAELNGSLKQKGLKRARSFTWEKTAVRVKEVLVEAMDKK